MKCKLCKHKDKLYVFNKEQFCRNHFPGPDPREQEQGYIDYSRSDNKIESLDYIMNSDDVAGGRFTEEMGLEHLALMESEFQQARHVEYEVMCYRLDQLEARGVIKKMLSPQQYWIYSHILKDHLKPAQIARLMGKPANHIHTQVKRIGIKLQKLFT